MPESRRDLEEGSICIALFSRGDGKFHWCIAVPQSTERSVQFHAMNYGNRWRYEKIDHATQRDRRVCVIVKIGTTRQNTLEQLDALLSTIPLVSPNEGEEEGEVFTCRIWVREAVKLMNRERHIACADALALEMEMKSLAEAQDENTRRGRGYRIHTSRYSR